MSRVQSIERAFAVLGALADGPIGVTEVADRVDLPKSTAARLLASLTHEGVVEQVPGDTRYRLGPRLVTLAARIRPNRSLAGLARPSLEDTRRRRRRGGRVCPCPTATSSTTSTRSSSPNPVSVRDWTGSRIPLHAVSSGQVLLAYAAPTFVQRYLGRPMERFTDRTLVTPTRCWSGCARSGATGTRGRSRNSTRISSVAAPVADASGEVVAAVHLHGPSYRFPAAGVEGPLAEQVVAAAARISGVSGRPVSPGRSGARRGASGRRTAPARGRTRWPGPARRRWSPAGAGWTS